MVAIVSGASLGLDLGSMRTLGKQGVAGTPDAGRGGEQVFVNVATGNLVVQHTDDVLMARGDEALALRTYNSQGTFADDNGDNWSSSVALQPLVLAGSRRYNAFGDQVAMTDAMANVTSYVYDRVGRRLSMTQAPVATYTVGASNLVAWQRTGVIVDSWSYDQLGRKLSQTNGNGETTRYFYDLRGNVVETRQPLGQPVRAAFDAQGRKIAEADANGYATTWSYDYFGLLIAHTDLGGARYAYGYDNARQLLSQTSTRGQSLSFGYDAAGQQTSITDAASGKVSSFLYDLGGRRVRERVVQGGVTYQDNHLAFDAQGNLRDVADARVHVSIDYDNVGNRTRVATSVDYQGVGGEASDTTQRFFRYDAMNRQVTVDAVDAVGNLGRQGHLVGYDRNGNRTSDTSWSADRVALAAGQQAITGYAADGAALYAAAAVTYSRGEGLSTEVYRYDALNRLQGVVRDGVQTDLRLYDGASRVVQSGPTAGVPALLTALVADALAGSSSGKDIRINRYDANGRMLHQKVLTAQGAARSDTSWDPTETLVNPFVAAVRAEGHDAAGNARGYVTASWEGDRPFNKFTNKLVRQEGYLAQQTTGSSSLTQPGSSSQQYDANGYLVGYADSAQASNNRSLVNDASGRVLWVNQAGNVQRQLVVNGEVLGVYGAGVNPANPSSGAAANPNFANLVDFDFGYARISASYPTASPGAYQVRPGDTLQTIAQSAYGDGRQWFRIAEANGLVSSTGLKVGQTLNIPATVGTARNNASTFRPYDPSRMTGDMTPVMAMPSGADGCGSAGKLLMVVVAVAVTVAIGDPTGSLAQMWTKLLPAAIPGTVSTAAVVATAATAAAAGSIASQMVGLATGDVRKFDWRGVALSAVSGGVTASIPVGAIGLTSTNVIVAKSMIANAMTQAIGVTVGLQQRFDWRGVAASGVGASIGQAVGDALPDNGSLASDILSRSVRGFAAGMAAAVARGGRVVIQQVAVDAFGNAAGEAFTLGDRPTPYETFRLSEIAKQNSEARLAALNAFIERECRTNQLPAFRSLMLPDVLGDTPFFSTDKVPQIFDAFDRSIAERSVELASVRPKAGLLPTATASGHYYLIGQVGEKLGIDRDRLLRIMKFSQIGDQLSITDGFTNGMRYRSTMDGYLPRDAGLLVMEALHALNGRTIDENILTYQRIISNHRDDDVVVGLALHALVDSIFHSYTDDKGVTRSFTSPDGHARKGSAQDYVSETQTADAARQVMIALENVSGKTLSEPQRVSILTSVDNTIQEAKAETFKQQGLFPSLFPSGEYRDINYKILAEKLLGSDSNLRAGMLRPNSIANPIWGNQLTYELTVEQGMTFLASSGHPVTKDDGERLINRTLSGMNKFVDTYLAGVSGARPVVPFDSAALYDSRPWSVPRYAAQSLSNFGARWVSATSRWIGSGIKAANRVMSGI